MKAVIFLVFWVAMSQCAINDWHTFKVTFGKSYSSSKEELHRRDVFEGNMQRIAEHNKLFQKGLVSYSLKMNKYGDMTDEEFEEMLLRGIQHSDQRGGSTFLRPSETELPDTVDWRKEKAVSRIRDQGHCGSCWAYSATGSLEGINFRKTGRLVTLSHQELIDCSNSYGNRGCQGGLPEHAFEYIRGTGGIVTEETYPYYKPSINCEFDKTNVGARITGFVNTKDGDEIELQVAVATVGPVSACIYASKSFRYYGGGVFKDCNCYNKSINHAVVVVGYGRENGEDYWLVKNSWGIGWGDDGYAKMARNSHNHCAIASYAVYPLV